MSAMRVRQSVADAHIAAYDRGLDDGRNGLPLNKDENPPQVWPTYVRAYNEGLDERQYWREYHLKRRTKR